LHGAADAPEGIVGAGVVSACCVLAGAAAVDSVQTPHDFLHLSFIYAGFAVHCPALAQPPQEDASSLQGGPAGMVCGCCVVADAAPVDSVQTPHDFLHLSFMYAEFAVH